MASGAVLARSTKIASHSVGTSLRQSGGKAAHTQNAWLSSRNTHWAP